jgi:hypothetical protein
MLTLAENNLHFAFSFYRNFELLNVHSSSIYEWLFAIVIVFFAMDFLTIYAFILV